MSDALEKLRHELEAAQRALAEAEARYVRQEAEHQSAIKEAEHTRRQVEQAHQEWMSALDAVADPIFVHDKDFRVLRCNRAYQRHAGIPFKQIIGQLYYEVFPKIHAPLPTCLQALGKAEAKTEEVLVGDTTYRSRAYSVMDGRGVYLYSVHTFENINESKRISGILQESELRYRRLFEAAKDGILILDAETGKILDANPFILKLLSYRLDECMGKMLWEIGLFKDIEASKEAFDELQSTGYIRYEDLPLQTKDGRQINVEFVSNRYGVGDHQVIQCNIRDITETLHTKEQLIASYDLLKTVVENTPIRVFWKDTELRYLGCNTAFAHDAGMSQPEDLIGKDDFQMGWHEQAELYRADDGRVMESGLPKLGYEEQQTTPDGRTIWLRTSKVPLRDSNGNVFGMLGIYEDITERKQAEILLRESETRLNAILEGALDGILLVETETRRLSAGNSAICRMLGYNPDELARLDVSDIHPQQDLPYVLEQFEKQKSGKMRGATDIPVKRKDGSVFYADINSSPVNFGGKDYLLGIVRDITERKQAEARLRESDLAYRTLAQNLPGMVYRVFVREHGRMGFYNEMAGQLTGYAIDELANGTVYSIEPLILDEDRPGVVTEVTNAMAEHRPFTVEYRLRHKDGSLRWMTEHGMPVNGLDEKPLYIDGVIFDVTAHKQVERQLQLFRTLLDNSSDAIEVIDPVTLRFLDINETECRDLGYSREEMLSMSITDIDPTFTPKLYEEIQNWMRLSGSVRFEAVHRRKDGSTFPVEVSTKMIVLDKTYALNIVRDITERRRAENELRESEEKFRTIFDHARDGIIVMDIDELSVKFANKSMERMLGYGTGELAGLPMPRLHPPEALAQVAAQFESDARGGQSNVQDIPMQTNDGRLLYADLSAAPVDIGGQRYMLGMFRDATERRASELSIRRANRALQTLSAGNLALVRATSEDELLQEVTTVIVEHGGYALVVVGYAEDDPEQSITFKAWSGYEGDRYWAEHLSWADAEHGQLPVSKAIRTGKTQVCHDLASDPAFIPWRDATQARGYVSNIALPMSDGIRTFGALSIYASEANAFDDEEVRLLEELANDLAYGIASLRTRKEHEQHTIILRQSLEQSIQTIAATLEARDPYTAGHQRRVAELATAIAREMGLPEDRINGLHLAAIIHDLGKIHVPAEILSKPGKLTKIEFMLIKEHPQDGYDILKDVKFPWPIAEMILQHHERMDGSGYPQGLQGEQILLESRILAVADVVEAMSSHRPYRASMGIEPALGEIKRGRSSAYDTAVADVCLKLFTEKKFAFSGDAL